MVVRLVLNSRQVIGFRVSHPPSGRILEVYSNQPGVQFYTSNSIPEKSVSESMISAS
jgi:galactose mutarotase-like enzyme